MHFSRWNRALSAPGDDTIIIRILTTFIVFGCAFRVLLEVEVIELHAVVARLLLHFPLSTLSHSSLWTLIRKL